MASKKNNVRRVLARLGRAVNEEQLLTDDESKALSDCLKGDKFDSATAIDLYNQFRARRQADALDKKAVIE